MNIKHVIFAVHGIYTGSYNWCDKFREFAMEKSKISPKVDVREYDFGFITATHMYLDGFCPWFAKGMCEKFSKWVKRKLSSYPSGTPYSFVAHSFGTWLTTEMLWRDTTLFPDKVILVAGVLSSHFKRTRWPEIFKQDRVGKLIVYWSPHDKVIERYSKPFFGLAPFGHLGSRGFVDGIEKENVEQIKTNETHSSYFVGMERAKYFNDFLGRILE